MRIPLCVLLLLLPLHAHDQRGRSHAPASSKALRNPAAPNPETGKALYEKACLGCHAPNRKAAPDLGSEHVAGLKDGEIYWIITNGIGAKMPALKAQMSDGDRWQLVHHVRTLRKDKPHETHRH